LVGDTRELVREGGKRGKGSGTRSTQEIGTVCGMLHAHELSPKHGYVGGGRVLNSDCMTH